jgi:Tfp pilus assembly protein PilF
MKKHKHNRRPRPRPPAPKDVLAAARARRARLRRISWIAGSGLALLLGFFVFQMRRPSIGSGPPLAGLTNRADKLSNQPPPSPGAGASSSDLPGATNRPGAVVNMEGQGRAADLNNRATQLLASGNPKQAIQLLQHALALTPKDETLHFNLGHAFVSVGDLTNAEHEYKEALHLLPDYPEAHNNYGNLLVSLGRLSEAEEQLTEAVKQMPESADFHNNLGVLRQRRKETNEALLCFQKAIECDSNHWQAHFNLALASLSRQNIERGIAELRATLKLRPGYEPAQHQLARVMGQVSSNAPAGAMTPR